MFQEGHGADSSTLYLARRGWAASLPGDTCQETPCAGRARAHKQDEQVLVKKQFSVLSLAQGCFYHESSPICWFDSRLRAGCALHAWKAQRNTDIRLIT